MTHNQTSEELRRLADAAEAIAAGRPYPSSPVSTAHEELGRLAAALERISCKLSAQHDEIREYDEALQRARTRFGEALRATHDLQRMLEIALETGMETVKARRALLMLRKGPAALVPGAARGFAMPSFILEAGRGVSGHVAATGEAVLIPGTHAITPDEREPQYPTQLSVPLRSRNRVLAVLNFYEKYEGWFTQTDLRTVRSLTDQAGVAIENVLSHQEAQRMAIMDGLTGIWNHRWFQIQLAREIDRAQRFRRPFSLVVMDIDDFKIFNDTYGHQVGDFVLVEVARRIKSTIRDVDMFARYGGEEFELLLSETDASGAQNAAEKMRKAISGTPFVTDMAAEQLRVTVSVGVATYPEAGLDPATLFKAADLAMYRAKSLGKNQVVVHRAGDGSGSRPRG